MYSDFINMTFLNMVVKIMKHIKLKFKITEICISLLKVLSNIVSSVAQMWL